MRSEKGGRYHSLYRQLLTIRNKEVVPPLKSGVSHQTTMKQIGPKALHVTWSFNCGEKLIVLFNLENRPITLSERPKGRPLYALPTTEGTIEIPNPIPPHSFFCLLDPST
ncbi:DUF3459 domain-containing protein [Magnetococcales bacterium HHB-1]